MGTHLLYLYASLCLSAATAEASQPPATVRVAIIAYEDFHGEFQHFGKLFAEINRRDPSFHFQLAVGSYGEVLHWLDRRLVDVAILTPGVFAGLLHREGGQVEVDPFRYLATVVLPAAKTQWASESRRSGRLVDRYHAVCLVSEDSPLREVDDLRAIARRGQVEFLFVHPLSLSGHVIPLEAMRRAEIDMSTAPRRFTYSHSQSIRVLRNGAGDRERVAFVWDDAAGLDRRLEQDVRKLPFPELDAISIPHDVVLVRDDFARADRLQELMLGDFEGQQRYQFVQEENWRDQFSQVRGWLDAAGKDSVPSQTERTSLDEIGHFLLQYSRSQLHPPRVALVLSGGGAKCSYQVGAVAAVEQRLAQLRRENPEYKLDIDLVVGTSGGAINSLPVAMGISRTEEGYQALRETWEGLDQRDIVQLPLLARINMGIWFACLQTLLVVLVVRWWVPPGNRRGWIFAAAYTALAAVEVVLGYAAPPPWEWLGTNHFWHHAWLWLSFGVRGSAWSLFVVGLGALALQAIRAKRGEHISLPQRVTMTLLLSAILGLPLLQIVILFHYEETLSSGRGMEQVMAQRFPQLINRELKLRGEPLLEVPANAGASTTLASVSRQILRRNLLQRDLVITGSCLEQPGQELPSDLYFYAPRNAAQGVSVFGKHGLSLREHPDVLLDVVLGSGSIYPIFPARRISDLPQQGGQIELIDGGYAHNSPIEAAVLWGATHIILVDVTPRAEMERGTFFRNLLSSVRHLHRQAQLLDTRSRGKVAIFTLSPELPHVCILDFANNLIAASIDKGYREATKDGITAPAQFIRELGQPVLVDIDSSWLQEQSDSDVATVSRRSSTTALSGGFRPAKSLRSSNVRTE